MTWVKINERLLEMEREMREELVDEWNELIGKAEKIAGCLKRKKYDKKSFRETKGKIENEKGDTGNHAVSLHGCMA